MIRSYLLPKFFGVSGFVFAIGAAKSHSADDVFLAAVAGLASGLVVASLLTIGTFVCTRYGGDVGRKLAGLGTASGEPLDLHQGRPPVAIGHEPRKGA
jgi:hypothetical protein